MAKTETHKTEKHVHAECKHCAHICKKCDVAYCCKCPREWRNMTYWTYSSSPVTTGYANTGTTISNVTAQATPTHAQAHGGT